MKETKFKNTEIGRIPDDWEVRTINSFCSVKTGPFGSMLHAEDYVAKGTPIVTTEHFKNGILPLVGKDIPQVGIEDLKRMSSYTLTKDDIVFSRVGSVDINALVTVRQKGWLFSGRVLRVRPFKQTDSLYLHYGLLKHSVRNDIVSRAVGLTMASINTKILGETELSLPPLNEQHSIASALTSIDNLISSLGKLIEKKKNIKQGAMQQLLTGKTRLKGFNEPWMEKKLGDIGSLAMCKRIFQEETSEKGDVPFYKIGTFGQQADAYITKGKYEQFKQMYRFPQKGDVLISAAGTIGRTVIYNGEPAYFQDSNIVWLAHNGKYITNNFLFYIYQRTGWNTEDTTIARLYNNNFNNTCIHFPSSITEQQVIANILSKMDNEITALETKKTKYEAIKQGMMQLLLTGKIRLIS